MNLMSLVRHPNEASTVACCRISHATFILQIHVVLPIHRCCLVLFPLNNVSSKPFKNCGHIDVFFPRGFKKLESVLIR